MPGVELLTISTILSDLSPDAIKIWKLFAVIVIIILIAFAASRLEGR